MSNPKMSNAKISNEVPIRSSKKVLAGLSWQVFSMYLVFKDGS